MEISRDKDKILPAIRMRVICSVGTLYVQMCVLYLPIGNYVSSVRFVRLSGITFILIVINKRIGTLY